jgi:hypothetical protein
MSSEEREDADLRKLVDSLIPIVRSRTLRAPDVSPETFTEEIWTLAALYTVRANLTEG